MTKLCELLVILSALPIAETVYKRWTKTTNFENPSNWNLGQLPCPNDRIIFPSTSPLVAMNQDWTISEMLLPNTGMIILSDNMNLVFNNNPTTSEGCASGRDIQYNNTEASHWLDPSNWCLPKHDFDSSCWENVLQLHTEMVPCIGDDVVFPSLTVGRRSSFFVNMDLQADMTIRSFQFGYHHFSTQGLMDYMNTDIGRKEFVKGIGLNPASLFINGSICVDPAGCFCGTDRTPWKERICAYAGQNCRTPYCDQPFTPKGHCCAVCGGAFEMIINTTVFSVYHLRNVIQSMFIDDKTTKWQFSDCTYGWFARKRSNKHGVRCKDVARTRYLSGNCIEELSITATDSNARAFGVTRITKFTTSGTPEITPTSAPTTPSTTTPTTLSTATSTSQIATSASVTPVSTNLPTKTESETSATKKHATDASTSSTTDASTSSTIDVSSTTTPFPINSGVTVALKSTHDTSKREMNAGTIIGITLVCLTVFLLLTIVLLCYLTRKRLESTPLAVSIKFDEEGGGTLEMVQGIGNPIYEQSPPEGDNGTAKQEVDQTPKRANGKSSKRNKKLSAGFDNPLYFDNKTETLGYEINGNAMTIDNPVFDISEENQPTGASFEDNFL